MQGYKRMGCLLLSVFLLLTGCGQAFSGSGATTEIAQEGGEEPSAFEADWGLTPSFTYEVPSMLPSVQIDVHGYDREAVKIAVLATKQEPEFFYLLDRTSGERVYDGRVQYKNDQKYAVFTDFVQDGIYRVVCDEVGQSVDFEIKENLNIQNLHQAVEAYRDLYEKQETITQECLQMICLLQALEIYPESFREENGTIGLMNDLARQAVSLLELQDAKTGKVFETEEQVAQAQTLALYCGTLAKFAYNYHSFDPQFATNCLKAADRTWKYMVANAAGYDSDEMFFAETELFRATGQTHYQQLLLAAWDKPIQNEKIRFYGEVTYLSTRTGVDTMVCANMMQRISQIAEQISVDSRAARYLVCEEAATQILWNMEILGVMNHIITNHEYDTVIANHLHFLYGRNESCTDMREEILRSPELIAEYIFMLAAAVGV